MKRIWLSALDSAWSFPVLASLNAGCHRSGAQDHELPSDLRTLAMTALALKAGLRRDTDQLDRISSRVRGVAIQDFHGPGFAIHPDPLAFLQLAGSSDHSGDCRDTVLASHHGSVRDRSAGFHDQGT